MSWQAGVTGSGLKVFTHSTDSPFTFFSLYTPFGGNDLYFSDGEKGVSLQPGTAHYFEHVLFTLPPLGRDGRPIKYRTLTPKTKRNLIDGLSLLAVNGAIRGNAYTWDDVTNYWMASRENQLENLGIMMDYVFTPYLPQDSFRKEKGIILDELRRDMNNPDSELYRTLCRQLYHRHGARFSTLGTEESIESMSLEDVLSVHNTFYRPSNMTLLASGNVGHEELMQVASDRLEAMGKGSYMPPPGREPVEEPASVVEPDNFAHPLIREDIAHPSVLGMWKIMMDGKNALDRHVASNLIALSLFGYGSRSRERLTKKGMEQLSFVGDYLPFREHGDVWFEGKTDDPEKFRMLVLNEAERVRKHGIPQEELDYARMSLLTYADESWDRVFDYADEMVRWGVLTGDPRNYEVMLERVEKIPSGLVNSYAAEILNPSNVSFALMRPA